MKNRKYERNTVDKISIKGILSDDCTYITFVNDDKEDEDVYLDKCFKPFAGHEITFSLSNKTTEDLEEELGE